MELGIYEQIINRFFKRKLDEMDQCKYYIGKKPIDKNNKVENGNADPRFSHAIREAQQCHIRLQIPYPTIPQTLLMEQRSDAGRYIIYYLII